MAKDKLVKSSTMKPVTGGNGKMLPKMGASPMPPAVTARPAGAKGGKFITGGGSKMAGFTGSKPAKAGVSK